jgi:capsular polysaccharide biosynthesis protein
MEIKEISKKLAKYKRVILLSVLAGLLIGIAYNFFPQKYSAQGSLYIKRTVENNPNTYFTYEGYYSQQVAIAYTNTIVALAESTDIRSKALTSLKIPVTEKNLRYYARSISVKKAGSQIITITVKGNDQESADKLWNSYANVLINTSDEINKNGDPNLSVSKISEQPVVKEPYRSIWVFGLAGAVLFGIVAIFILSVKEYFTGK